MRAVVGATRVRLRSRAPLFSTGLLLWIARSTRWLLRLLNPHAQVWLDRDPLHLGDEFRVEWSFRRGLTPLRNLRVTLEGAEFIVESDIEESDTYVHVFSTALIYEGPFTGAQAGSGRAAVARSSMPSFGTGRRARIEWAVHISGTPRVPWPRTDDYYVVKVLPNAVQ